MTAATVTRARRFGALAFLAVASLLVGTSSLLAPANSAQAMAKLAPSLQRDIAEMTTGAVEIDELGAAQIVDAQSRNLAIPMMKGRLETAGRFASIPLSSASYKTANQCLAQAVYYEAALEPERASVQLHRSS